MMLSHELITIITPNTTIIFTCICMYTEEYLKWAVCTIKKIGFMLDSGINRKRGLAFSTISL